jgi:bifunctional UDP-N-acetylglucosamine pyrophosphorylase/glucosamine-1-phosphate N-acetyltransferase
MHDAAQQPDQKHEGKPLMTIGFMLIAAGYGFLRMTETGAPVSKVLEPVRRLPMFLHPLIAAQDAGMTNLVIVANPLYLRAMREETGRALDAGLLSEEPTFVVQPDRYGAAHAVQCAIPAAIARGMSRALVCYGDMPLWSSSTMRWLATASLGSDVVAMATVERSASSPALDRYGRVVRDESGNIERVVEVNDASPEELALSTVNPSLWVWNLAWLARNIPKVDSVERPDGRTREIYMPPLIAMARVQGAFIRETRLPVAWAHEALGVNSHAELSHIRALME